MAMCCGNPTMTTEFLNRHFGHRLALNIDAGATIIILLPDYPRLEYLWHAIHYSHIEIERHSRDKGLHQVVYHIPFAMMDGARDHN